VSECEQLCETRKKQECGGCEIAVTALLKKRKVVCVGADVGGTHSKKRKPHRIARRGGEETLKSSGETLT
jgi:hypothetical protein